MVVGSALILFNNKTIIITLFIILLVHDKHYAKHIIAIVLFSPHNILVTQVIVWLTFKEEGIGPEQWNYLSKSHS